MYFRPTNSDINLVKLDAKVTIRPSASNLTTKKNFKCEDPGPLEETIVLDEFDQKKDPELK